ncbi:MAG: thioesterase family protein [Rhizobiaceae bacterium]
MPILSRLMDVERQWTDYNGHLNMAYYNVLFDRAADEGLEVLGMGPAYARDRRLTVYTAEIHVCYLRELHAGHKVRGTFQLLDHDGKRLHSFQELRHEDGWLAATSEVLSLHVDMAGPNVAPFPPDVLAKVEAMAARHASLPRPAQARKSIGIRRK